MAKKYIRLKIIIFVLACLLSSIIYMGIEFFMNKKIEPISLDLKSSMNYEVNNNRIITFKDNIIVHEKDYISILDKEGGLVYHIEAKYSKPFLIKSNNLFFTGDMDKGYVVAMDETGQINWEYTAAYKISDLTTNETGKVAILMETDSQNTIVVLNEQGQSLSKFNMNKVKVMDMALSKDGDKVAISILEIGENIKSSALMYWSKGGLIGAQNYKDEVIPKIKFDSQDSLICVGDKSVTLFDKSGLIWKRVIDGNLNNLSISESGYIGLNITKEKRAIIDTKSQNMILIIDEENKEQWINGVDNNIIDMNFIDENLFFCTERTIYYLGRDIINKNKLIGSKEIKQDNLNEKKINSDIKFIKIFNDTNLLLGTKDKIKIMGINYNE